MKDTPEQLVRLWYQIRGLTPPIWKQVGAGYIAYRGHPFQIREDMSGSNFMIYGGRKVFEAPTKSNPCFILQLYPDTKIAVLQSVSRGEDCFMDGTDDSAGIVHIAVWQARKHGMAALEFTDNSVIYCPERTDLSDLSFITTGSTWYERILPGCQPSEPDKVAHLNNTKQRINMILWKDVWRWITPNHEALIPAAGEPTELAHVVLERLKKSGDHCQFFSDCASGLCRAFGLPSSLFGWSWIVLFTVSPSYAKSDIVDNRRRKTQKRRIATVSVIKE